MECTSKIEDKNYFVISIKDRNFVTHSMRKKLQKSFYGDLETCKYGQIDKFCKALGYFDVIDDIVKTYPVIKTAKCPTPSTYTDPAQLLFHSLYVDLSKTGYWTFYIPECFERHPQKEYSYFSQDIVYKFYKFLLKVYPNLFITLDYQKNYSPQLKTKVLNWFYQSMSSTVTNGHYTVEVSSTRMLSNTEKSKIETVLREMTDYPFHIEQYFCETCKGYDPTCPYHIEIVYDD